MFQVPLSTSSTTTALERFWDSVILYYNRPHLVNRKITAASQSLIYEISSNLETVFIQGVLNRSAILYELRKLNDITFNDTSNEKFLKSLLECYDKHLQLHEISLDELKGCSKGLFASVRILFPRMKNFPRAIEVVTFDKELNKITFLAVSDSEKLLIAPPFAYEIELTTTLNLRINVTSFEEADTAHAQWLADKLFMKLIKWTENIEDNKQNIGSLSLVKVNEYCSTYNGLKEKYGFKLVQEWPNNSGTDPQKYVFEDIAIASYLICLWGNDPEVKFVDCGCGNGLLVFLLSQEGYDGYGVDVRRRPIWDIYPQSTRLKIGTVGPNSTFPESTWIIGNHSDELTPWIPVISLKSSLSTNFFALPCCTYDFSGHKYVRKNASISAYADYLMYVEDISNKCGFTISIDKLRIPSTKRTCLIGRRKALDIEKHNEILKEISELVDTKISGKFTQRTDVEKVRNCTQLDKNLVSSIINCCVNKLLSGEQYIKKSSGELWNKGISLPISGLVQHVPKDDLKRLKQECGGLQTLLKNHRYLFEVTNGSVKIRLPLHIEETSKFKDKPCWFVENHPNGCLYDGFNCGYKHE